MFLYVYFYGCIIQEADKDLQNLKLSVCCILLTWSLIRATFH